MKELDLSHNNKLQYFFIADPNFQTGEISSTVETLYLPVGMDVSKFLNEIPDTVTIYVGETLYRLSSTATSTPTPTPTEEPTAAPTKAEKPTVSPTSTDVPTAAPTVTPEATAAPTVTPEATAAPTATPEATVAPTATPTAEPTAAAPSVTTVPTATPAAEDEITVNGLIYTINKGSKKTLTLKGFKKSKAKLSIPATVKIKKTKYKVTEIADKAFKGNKKLKQVTIGKNISVIGKEAFSGCSKLQSVTVKSKVLKKVGKNAFKGISKKAVVTVPLAKQKKLFGKIKTVVKK